MIQLRLSDFGLFDNDHWRASPIYCKVSRLSETDEYATCEESTAAKPEEISHLWAIWMMAGDKDDDYCASEATTVSAHSDGPGHHASLVFSFILLRVLLAVFISGSGSRCSTLTDPTY